MSHLSAIQQLAQIFQPNARRFEFCYQSGVRAKRMGWSDVSPFTKESESLFFACGYKGIKPESELRQSLRI